MEVNLEQLEEMQKELFRQQCDLDIQKAMVKHFIKEKQAEQLNLTDVGGSYSKKQVEDAYDKGFKDAMLKYRK